MSRWSLLCILSHPFASAAHVFTHTLRCGSKRCANLLCKSCAVLEEYSYLPSCAEALEWRGSYCLYVHGFRFYFTPLTGVLFAFPSRYWFTIGQLGVFSLRWWSTYIQSKFHVLRPTRFHLRCIFVYGTITLYRHTFQNVPLTHNKLKGWSGFARRYFRNLGWFLFLRVLRCFSSPRSPLTPMYSVQDTCKQVGFPIRKS